MLFVKITKFLEFSKKITIKTIVFSNSEPSNEIDFLEQQSTPTDGNEQLSLFDRVTNIYSISLYFAKKKQKFNFWE